jgi:hypothetical protein
MGAKKNPCLIVFDIAVLIACMSLPDFDDQVAKNLYSQGLKRR